MSKYNFNDEVYDEEDLRRGRKKESHRRRDRDRTHKKSWDELSDEENTKNDWYSVPHRR